MSTITPSNIALPDYPGVVQKKWLMGSADTGVAVGLVDFPDKTITVTGTWDSATLVVAGSNDGVTFVTMTDPQGNALSKTADFIEALLENPLYIRVSTSGGGGTPTALVVLLTARKG